MLAQRFFLILHLVLAEQLIFINFFTKGQFFSLHKQNNATNCLAGKEFNCKVRF